MLESSQVTQDGTSFSAFSVLFFFHHHSNAKNNSCHSHDDNKQVKQDKKKIVFQMTARFNVTASLDLYLEIQENTHLKERIQNPSPGLLHVLLSSKQKYLFSITFN